MIISVGTYYIFPLQRVSLQTRFLMFHFSIVTNNQIANNIV